MRTTLWTRASCMVLATSLLATPGAALAQEGVTQIEQVVVTARMRQESDISVPVSVTAISAQQIDRQAILNMYDVAQRTPTLSINNNSSGGGGSIFLRGIGTVANISSTLDQSISLSIDGAPISRGNALRVGQYDLEQIEILKGPQALFFGKNSPAGVISFKSKEPTAEFDASAKLSYEPYANNRFAEVAVSGPLTDALRARAFVHVGATDGEKDNLSALGLPANAILPGSVTAHPSDHAWGNKETFVRGTLVFEPNDRFKARLTSSYDILDGIGTGSLRERYYCPRGRAQTTTLAALLGGGANTPALANALSVDDCKLNGTIFQGGINPAFLVSPQSITRDPAGLGKSQVNINVADATYKLTDAIDLTSVTAFARISDRNIDHFTWAPAALPLLTFYNYVLQSQLSEELRATTHFKSPLNFMIGGFYQTADFDTFSANTALAPFNVFQFHVPNQVYSAFGQALWDLTPEVELAAGVRLTREKKSLRLTRDGVPQPTASPSVTFDNASPEATLTWRPSSDLSAYVAYKSGFKSGGYAATISGNGPPLAATPARDFLYRPESAKGFEGGLKTALLDRSLRLDTTVYAYEYGNLQVTNVDASTGVPVQRVFNAATARQQGIEVEGAYYPQAVSGLRISGMANYNKSYYAQFNSPCYIGQSIAEGCNLVPTATGAFTTQSLQGRRFTNAPLWVGALGFSYARPVGRLRLEFGADAVYKSSYNATSDANPGGVQKAYTVLSGQIRLMNEARSWEIGLYAKNLTDVQRALESSPVPLTGTSAATGTVNGGVGARSDLAANTNPGRAVFIQLVLRPSAWMTK
jgi:iron complex outermembrane receptor protein